MPNPFMTNWPTGHGPMTDPADKETEQGSLLKRSGISGLVVGTLAILACELPLIIIALGLGGVTGFSALANFDAPPALEIGGFVIVTISWLALIYLFIRNRRRRKDGMAR